MKRSDVDVPMAQDELKSKIAKLRERQGLTQRKLAEEVGVTENTIANWERGRRAIEFIDKLIKLCEVLHCDIRDLIERPSIDLKEVNLADEDFRGKDLSKAQLERTNLSGANFQGVKLVDAKLLYANLQAADLENANLKGVVLDGANLTYANLKGADLTDASLKKANLSHTDLRGAFLQNADLTDAKVRTAMLQGADLTGVKGLPEGKEVSEVSPLIIGGIPDQDSEKLIQMYNSLSQYLQATLGIEVESYETPTHHGYINPDQNYSSIVKTFGRGNIDLVWLGGFTLIQALDHAPDATVIAQRDIDQTFYTVLIAKKSVASRLGYTKLASSPNGDPEALKRLHQVSKKLKFAFGSKWSTSGDLIPLHYLVKAGLKGDCFEALRFSGSHDATIRLVASGLSDVGVLSKQVWDSRKQAQEPIQEKLVQIWQSPPYHNYAWVLHTNALERYGAGMIETLQQALLKLNHNQARGHELLELFGATEFIQADVSDYENLRAIVQQREQDEAFFWSK